MQGVTRPTFSSFLKENALFLSCFGAFILVGGILLLSLEQGAGIFYFNNHRSYWGDLFFKYFTKVGEELAFILIFIALLFYRFRHALYIPILGIVVTIVSALSKSYFHHDRPSLYFRKLQLFDQINPVEGVFLNGGTTSFPSGHTMAAFALYSFLAFCLIQKRGMALLLFLIALLVGISRIYLVQHFIKDVYLGAIMGVLLAVCAYFLQYIIPSYSNKRWDRSLKFPTKTSKTAEVAEVAVKQ